jgi:extracellular elastinolytic metalloproteinase
MARELDKRKVHMNRVAPAKENLRTFEADASESLKGEQKVHIEKFDPLTGNPSIVVSESSPAIKNNYVQRALDHLQSIHTVLGFAENQSPEFVPDPHVQKTSAGAAAVHVHQHYKGIPIFQATETVRFSPDGALKETVGNPVTVAQELTPSPKVSIQDAVLKAAAHVAVPQEDERNQVDPFGQSVPQPAVDLTYFVPKIVTSFEEKPDRPSVLEPGPFADKITCKLIWFPLGSDESSGGGGSNLRLTWEVILTMPNFAGQYRVLVDAENGEILYSKQLMRSILARGNVFRQDGSQARQMTEFPCALSDHDFTISSDLPTDFPDQWIDTDSTMGNSTKAHLDENGMMLKGVKLSVTDNKIIFDPADPFGDEQKILNIFYYNCFMHDFFYLLGFREADGNFQFNNFGRGGVGSDRVNARSFGIRIPGTANIRTPPDGFSPTMNMGLVESTNRHTALDSTVVFHEFTHGVTNRLVGGRMDARALEEDQSAGMGEGWGDYIACTINDTNVVGSWVVNKPNGIRKFRYDEIFPDDFRKLGTGRYNEVHNIGEIWCATLMAMNRRIGKNIALQLVIDALKLSPSNPSFLDMRDSILLAFENMLSADKIKPDQADSIRRGIWEAFAKFGMGPGARSNGATLFGIIADKSMPTI